MVPCAVAARRYDLYQNCDVLVITNDPGRIVAANR
jgi:hypothetical protein